MKRPVDRSQSATATTTLATGTIAGYWRHILNATNAHAGTCERTKSGLGTGTRSLGRCSTGSSQLDVQSRDTDFLAAHSSILGRKHGCVRRGLITVCLNLHATCCASDRRVISRMRSVAQVASSQKSRWLNAVLVRSVLSLPSKRPLMSPAPALLIGREHSPVTREMVSFPERSVMWTKVSLKEAKMCACAGDGTRRW